MIISRKRRKIKYKEFNTEAGFGQIQQSGVDNKGWVWRGAFPSQSWVGHDEGTMLVLRLY